MARRGSATKLKIMDVAEDLVMEQGFTATSVDQILAGAGVTKGAFFHHFKSKAELAHALVQRYVERDDAALHHLMEKAESLSRDPLQQIIIFIGLFEDALRGMDQVHPGCMIASFLYQFEDFDIDTKNTVIRGFDEWHRVLDEKFRQAQHLHRAKIELSPTQLVDNFLSAFEGGLIMAKLMSEPQALADQLKHYKHYIELLFDQV